MAALARFDPSLYLVTDEGIAGGRALVEVVRQAIDGGVTLVQVRDKQASTRTLVERVREIREAASARDVPVLVNDRVDVALAAAADGAHVGSDDLPVPIARKLLGGEAILGVTVTGVDSARRAEEAGADYVACSSVFATPTKPDSGPPVGLEGLARIVDAVRVPVVAIGGIDANNAAAVLATGAAGIAVVSAIVGAQDCRVASAVLRSIVDRCRLVRPLPDGG